jgi:two-component system LytT family response regulator
MKVRTLIVDDEALGRKRLRKLLESETECELIGECCDGQEAVAAIQAFTPDLLFLDVQMPELNGFEVLAQLNGNRLPVIIFVTAYDQYALKAFEAQAIDYLLKPFEDERFYQALHRARAYIEGQQSQDINARLQTLVNSMSLRAKPMTRMAVKTAGRIVFIKTSEIDWIEAVGNYLNLHIGTEAHLLRGRISELEKRLDPGQFFRTHRSTIVNLDRVKEFQTLFKGDGVAILKNGTRVAVSRSSSQRLQALLTPRL